MAHLAAFPKCYLDDIIIHKSMTLFDWVEKARQLGVDGLEMHNLFFEEKRDGYLDEVRNKCEEYGLAMPMMCFSRILRIPISRTALRSLQNRRKPSI